MTYNILMRSERSAALARTREQRMNNLLDLVKQGLTADQIHNELPRMRSRLHGRRDNSESIGRETEERVFGLLQSHYLVQQIIKAPDSQEAIDGVIKFVDGFKKTSVGLQVKSSQLGVDRFLDEDHYGDVQRKYGDVVVINGGPAVTNRQIFEQFESQLAELGCLDNTS